MPVHLHFRYIYDRFAERKRPWLIAHRRNRRNRRNRIGLHQTLERISINLASHARFQPRVERRVIICARRGSSIRSFQTVSKYGHLVPFEFLVESRWKYPWRFLFAAFVSGKFAVASEVTFDLPLYRPLHPPQVVEKDSSTRCASFSDFQFRLLFKSYDDRF